MISSTFLSLRLRTPFKIVISSSLRGSDELRWNCRKDLSSAFLYVLPSSDAPRTRSKSHAIGYAIGAGCGESASATAYRVRSMINLQNRYIKIKTNVEHLAPICSPYLVSRHSIRTWAQEHLGMRAHLEQAACGMILRTDPMSLGSQRLHEPQSLTRCGKYIRTA